MRRLKAAGRGDLSVITIMHSHRQTLDIADRIMLMRRGTVTYEKAAAETSVRVLMNIVRREYRAVRSV